MVVQDWSCSVAFETVSQCISRAKMQNRLFPPLVKITVWWFAKIRNVIPKLFFLQLLKKMKALKMKEHQGV